MMISDESRIAQRWLHNHQTVRDWSGLIKTLHWQLCHKLVVGRFVSQRLVSYDHTPVSDESMMISDESRTGQGWVRDDQWRVQDWYWGEFIKTIDWQLNQGMGPRLAKDHHLPVPDGPRPSRTGQDWSGLVRTLHWQLFHILVVGREKSVCRVTRHPFILPRICPRQ